MKISVRNHELSTKRLRLRPWTMGDVDDFFAYASVEGVGEMAGWPHHINIEVSESVLKSFIADDDVFAIVDKGSGRVIGSFGIHNSWANKDPKLSVLNIKELGYVLAKPYWGQGLMSEAVSAVLELCFDVYNLDAVTCAHFTSNTQSQRVISKSGFTFVERVEEHLPLLQKDVSVCRYIKYR